MCISDWSSDVCSSDLHSRVSVLCCSFWTQIGQSSIKRTLEMIVCAESDLHPKFTQCFFLVRFKDAFDCSVKKLAAHLVKVSVRVKSFKIGRASCRERVCQYV